MKRFILMLQLMTIIPLLHREMPDEKDFAGSAIFLPLVGLLVGGGMAATHYVASLYFSSLAAAALTIAAGAIITGGLHLDGLADTCDGILSHRSREEMLRIMKDSRLGAMGGIALTLFLVLKIALLAGLGEGHAGKLLLVMPVIGRMAVSWVAGLSRYARTEGGLGGAIIAHTGAWEILMSTVLSGAIVYLCLGSEGLVPLAAAIVFCLILTAFISRKLGGTTGDVLGCAIELTELIVLLTFGVLQRLAMVN